MHLFSLLCFNLEKFSRVNVSRLNWGGDSIVTNVFESFRIEQSILE
jgi:hypothetical protein